MELTKRKLERKIKLFDEHIKLLEATAIEAQKGADKVMVNLNKIYTEHDNYPPLLKHYIKQTRNATEKKYVHIYKQVGEAMADRIILEKSKLEELLKGGNDA